MKVLPDDPNTLLTRRELAAILPVTYDTLAHWSSQGDGPPVIKVGARRVVYRAGDVLDWLERRKKGGRE